MLLDKFYIRDFKIDFGTKSEIYNKYQGVNE